MSILKIKDSQGNWVGVPTVKGDTGNGISSAVLNDDYTLTLTFTDGTSYTTPSIRGEKGIKGDIGNGIASTVLNNDYTLTINFTNGTQYITPPIRGQQGERGDTPNITASKTGDTTYIYADGVEVAQIKDGTNGTNGIDGDDGYSPTANVTKSGKTATITITDKNGTTSAQVEDGTDGTDGVSPIVSVSSITGGHEVSITDAQGTQTFDVMDGTTPTVPVQDVQINGTSILNNGVANIPLPQNVTVTGTTPTITAQADTRYVCGEVSTLDITVPSSGIIDVIFTSGATATVLTVTPPTGMTMKWANGFDPTSLDANTTYEINIMDGLGVCGTWT